MLNKKALDRTYDEIARNVLGRMAELPQLRELKTELSSWADEGWRWDGQRIWFYDDAEHAFFESNYWLMGDLPYADKIAAVMLRFRRSGTALYRTLYFERDQHCLRESSAVKGASPELPEDCFAGRAEALHAVYTGTRRTHLETCGLPIALEGAEYPMLIWEPVLTAFGLLAPKQKHDFDAELNREPYLEYGWEWWSDEEEENGAWEEMTAEDRLQFRKTALLPPFAVRQTEAAESEDSDGLCMDAIIEARLERGLNEDGSEREPDDGWLYSSGEEDELPMVLAEDLEPADDEDAVPLSWSDQFPLDPSERPLPAPARVRGILDALGDAGFRFFGETVMAQREEFPDVLDCLEQDHRMPYQIRSVEMAFLDEPGKNVALLSLHAKNGALLVEWGGMDCLLSAEDYLKRFREAQKDAYDLSSLAGGMDYRNEDPLSYYVDPPMPGEAFYAIYPEPVLDDLLFEYGLVGEL